MFFYIGTIPTKCRIGPNELLYGVLYYIFGFASPYLFASDHLTFGLENTLFMYLFLGFIGLDAFWWIGNFLPNIIYCKQHPEEIQKRSFSEFAEKLENNHSETLKRDVSRKLLHVILMVLVIGLYLYARANQVLIQNTWENYWAFCKFCYTFIAFAFCNMFTLADMTRVNKFHWLPQWARKWFSTSLSPKRTLYVYFEYTLYFIIQLFSNLRQFKYFLSQL